MRRLADDLLVVRMSAPTPADSLSPAIERALARAAAKVERVGWGHGLSAAQVDEIFQEVRIRLWRSLGTSERIESATPFYVYRTALSATVDLIRRRRRRREEDLSDAVEAVEAVSPRPDAAVESGELSERVFRIVDGLLESRRPVVRMYLAGYPPADIADFLGWSEAKTRNLLYRGLSDLRERLLEVGIGPEGKR